VLNNTTQYGMTQYSTVQYGTVKYGTVYYSTVRYRKVQGTEIQSNSTVVVSHVRDCRHDDARLLLVVLERILIFV